jgi:hypothetical protein
MLHIIRKLEGHKEATKNKIDSLLSKLPEDKKKEILGIYEIDVNK